MALPDREGEELVHDTINFPLFYTLARVVPTYNHPHPLPTLAELKDNDARWILACIHDHLRLYILKLWGILLWVVEPLDKVETYREGEEEKTWIYVKWLMKSTYRQVKEGILRRMKKEHLDVPRE